MGTAPLSLNGQRRLRVVTVMGTRPEAIKLVPVVRALDARPAVFEQVVLATAQHREMLDQVLAVFGLSLDVDLALMQEDQGVAEFAALALSRLSEVFAELGPDVVLVQGDTATVTAAALAAFYGGIRVGHVEAGLRSFDRRNPFPEEVNRRIASCVGDFHFAPTERARENLLAERVDDASIFVTGNTIVDALLALPEKDRFADPALEAVGFAGRRVMLVTAHRRENHGAPLLEICRALRDLTLRFADVEVLYPVHLNPHVRETVFRELADVERVHLVEPLDYDDLLKAMRLCHLILTDSGGIQEEAPSFRKPVLVLRETTERPELIEAGLGRLTGTSRSRIVADASLLLTDRGVYERMSAGPNPFGDGRAAERIADVLERELSPLASAQRRPVEVGA